METIFYFVPKRRATKTFFHCFVQSRFIIFTLNAQAVGDVFINRFRKRIRFLKNHAHAFAEPDWVDIRVVYIVAIDLDIAAFDPRGIHQIVHAIEAAQEGRFSTTGWSDKRGNALLVEIEVDIEQRLFFTVTEIEIGYFDQRPRRIGLDGIRVYGERTRSRNGAAGFAHGFGGWHGGSGGYH